MTDINIGFKDMLADANAGIETMSLEDAMAIHNDEDVVIVDLRDIRELQREGMIPGAFHCPRGMLEFWVHPESPYHKPVFAEAKKFIFYCGSGWRSALATRDIQNLGLSPVAHIEGGFSAWKDAAGPIEQKQTRSKA